MARMHSRDKGKSGSKAPPAKMVPEWVEVSAEEATEAIINLANSGQRASEIGLILRDQFGVPNIKLLTGKTVQQILKEHDLLGEVPEDLLNLIKKSVTLNEHMKRNKKDMTAKRGYQLTVSKIRRLTKYYHRSGVLPRTWKYTEESARLLVK